MTKELTKEAEKETSMRFSGKGAELSIVLSAYVYQRMRFLVDNVDAEVAWFGTVEKTGNVFNITEIYVPEQEVTASSVEADAEMVSNLLPELIEKHGKEEALMDIMPKMRAFCHSHHTMKTFWSSTDEGGINGLANSHYLVSLVLNRGNDILGRVDFFKPYRMTIDNVVVKIDYKASFEDLQKDVDEKVQTKKVSYQKTGTPYFGGVGSSYYGGQGSYYGSTSTKGAIGTVKAYGLPNLVIKAHPELKDMCRILLTAHSKPKAIKDIAFLIFALNYENNELKDRHKELMNLFTALLKVSTLEKLKPTIIWELVSVVKMFGSTAAVNSHDPAKVLKSDTAVNILNLMKNRYNLNAGSTYCVKP